VANLPVAHLDVKFSNCALPRPCCRRYIVANLPLTFAVIRGCQAVGVQSFGAIWDS
jgi:hypothetical protein